MGQARTIEPFREILAYEGLWQHSKASFKWLSELFANNPDMRPSDLAGPQQMEALAEKVKNIVHHPSVPYKVYLLLNGTFNYPTGLKDAGEPVPACGRVGVVQGTGRRVVVESIAPFCKRMYAGAGCYSPVKM